MEALLIIFIRGVGFSLAGCVVPVVVEHRHDGDGRSDYPGKVGVMPVIEVGR